MQGKAGVLSALRGVTAALVCSTVLLAVPPSSAFAWGPYNHLDPAFCDTTTVRGDPAQLKALPDLHEAPASARLPFTPDTVSFKALDQFQVGDGEIGFTFRQRDGKRSPLLGLNLTATFAKVDRRGRMSALLKRTSMQVSSIKGYETIPVSIDVGLPGLYRASITIADSDGVLSRFGSYTRLLPLIVRPPRLAINARSFTPGERLLARVENFSTASVSYGVPYSIQRWNGSTWERVPESPGKFIKPLYHSLPGGTGPCLPFGIPDTMQPGTYRMAKPIRTSRGARALYAEFSVSTAAGPRTSRPRP